MKLSYKILLTLSVTLSLYWIANYVVKRTIIMPRFQLLEQQHEQEHLQHILNLLKFSTDALATFCLDWAGRDDSYAFIEGKNSAAYVDSNLGKNTFISNDLQLICYLDKQLNVVWEGTLDQYRFPSLQNNWHKNVQFKKDGLPCGFYMTSSGPMVLVVQPISNNDEPLSAGGFLVMGRLLRPQTLSRIADCANADLRLLPLTPGKELTELQLHTLIFDKNPLISQSGNFMHIYNLIYSPENNPAFIFALTTNRNARAKSNTAFRFEVLSNALSGLITMIILILFFRRNISRPLSQLTTYVSNINTTKDLSGITLDVPQDDEIGALRQGFNQMAQRLQKNHELMKTAQQSLLAEKKKVSAIFDTAPDGIVTVHHNGTIENLNKAAANMFGYTINELKGQSIAILAQKEYAELLLETMRIYPESGHKKCFKTGCEMIGRSADDESIPVHMKASPLTIDNQVLFVWLIRDISALKAMNEKMAHTKRLAIIGEMGASIAHEIRNPLAGISGAIQMLRKLTRDNPHHMAILNEIIVQVMRIENTVDQMLNYSRAWTPKRQDVSPLPLLDRIASEIGDTKKFRHITFAGKGYDQGTIPIDPELIRQVILNIFNNAADAMPDGGEIFYNVVAGTNYANISIKDTGKGMTEETMTKLFTPFFTTKIYGTGLGLAICQRIIEAHCGSIEVQSIVNEGTEVVIRLPLIHDLCSC